MERGVKHPLLEKAVLKANFRHRPFVRMSAAVLESLPTGEPILFADGTLVRGPESGTVYMISRGEKRPFRSADVFGSLGFNWSQIISSNGATLALHQEGASLDLGATIPNELPPELIQAATGSMKSQIPKLKLQINSNTQKVNHRNGLVFGAWKLEF